MTDIPLPHLPTPDQVRNLSAAEAASLAQALNAPNSLTALTDAEKLTALETYIKMLEPLAKALRATVTEDMGARHVERVGAYLPDGVKIGAVGYSAGNRTAKVTDPAAALQWALDRYPGEIVRAVNPAFLKMLTDHAKATGQVGEPGVDPRTGEVLEFIEVRQGGPYVTVTTTEDGLARMAAAARKFTPALEGAPQYDPDFADRLENGAYAR